MGDEEITLEMLKNSTFDLDIPNFEKWNPDSRKRRLWFALAVDWYNDPKVIQLTLPQRALWLHLISIRAASRSHLTRISCASLALRMRFQGGSIALLLLKLLKLQLIELRSFSLQTIQTNNTNKQPKTDLNAANAAGQTALIKPKQPSFDFSILYKQYPRKVGKKRGMELCSQKIKTSEDFEKLGQAIQKYARYCQTEGKAPQYIKHFDTFMGCWEDWTDTDVGNSHIESSQFDTSVLWEENENNA